MDVCGNEPQEKLKVGLDEVPDDLVIVVHVILFGHFGPGWSTKGNVRRAVFDTPRVLP